MQFLTVFLFCLLALGVLSDATDRKVHSMTWRKVESGKVTDSQTPNLRQRRWGGYYGGFGGPFGWGWRRPFYGGFGMPFGGFGGYPFWGR